MAHFTDNPLVDATNHIREADSGEHEFDYKCDACEQGFDSGHGIKIGDEKFCDPCINKNNHFQFYFDCGLTVAQVWELTSHFKML